MKKYEYMDLESHEQKREDHLKRLNELGEQGWEMVNEARIHGHHVATLKREKE